MSRSLVSAHKSDNITQSSIHNQPQCLTLLPLPSYLTLIVFGYTQLLRNHDVQTDLVRLAERKERPFPFLLSMPLHSTTLFRCPLPHSTPWPLMPGGIYTHYTLKWYRFDSRALSGGEYGLTLIDFRNEYHGLWGLQTVSKNDR